MSRRGGGRRSDHSREQQPSPATSVAPLGGGRGVGGRGGRGTGDCFPPPSSTHSLTVFQTGPSSSASDSLSIDVEQKLTLEVSATELPPASSKAVRFPPRPGFGTVGNKCVVRANHFLVSLADRDLYHYDVSITPEVTSRKISRAVITQLVISYRQSHLGNRRPVYDGKKSLYTAGSLPFSSKEFVVKLVDKDGEAGQRREREFKVAIKLASRADLHHLQQFLNGKQMDTPQETIQVLDVVLRESPSRKYTVVGRSFFSQTLGQGDESREIGDGLEYWRGFYQSLRPTQMGLSLNIDVSATSFYESVKVSDFATKYLNIRDPKKPLSDTDRIKLKKVLRGLRVEVLHVQHVRRYKVSGVTTQPLSHLTFPLDESGKSISVIQYFFEKYGVRLQYPSLPALQSGSDIKPIYLPMEVCKIVPGQRFCKKLNERQVTALLRATCKRPRERENSIAQMVRENNYNRDEYAVEFGIQVTNTPATIEARVLPPPVLRYHETGREKKVQPDMGQWNMINMKMLNGGTVEYWACVNFSSRLNSNIACQFCQELVRMCSSKGMAFNPNPLLNMFSARPDQIERTLREVLNRSEKALTSKGVKGKQLQLLIIILPDVGGLYGTIKRICETELGLVSQCCQPKHAGKMGKQYLENLSLKINVKVGGRNTVLADAIEKRIPLVTDRPTIIFGADVTHPQPGEDSSPSIAAVVASMDWPEVTKYRGLVSAQGHRVELIEDLYKVVNDSQRGMVHGGMIRELLISFRRSTNQKPHRILFFRDGVSEGQFSQVLLYEMDAIRKACASLEEGYLPPVTFVVVQKRHHTRLFPADHNNRAFTDRSGNILPGTVVDTKICHPTEFDFYLCSHAGIQGTSRPTHYHVLLDENNFSPNALQTLTNNLCYTYARCTRSVSLVPPAYYAHLFAFRARYYIEGDQSDSGSSAGARSCTREKGGAVKALPQIKGNVKDVMFYC
ncbi:PREDICTED: protein argonaute 5-like isoform X2 [Nelumbo nucifera]|uniref:Protein argonaute 5 n=2 Tax=Nelumbo nucifera TaxID=4432 RepID=A0A822YAU8_NELNU|nr:PREDICTED: protein argonaute 5-like isoform X2 [Nelumbo nucifera]DAD28651.1 TPA_asm: hypothetical protein HUJ06_030119 [Nelumbo nucifera]